MPSSPVGMITAHRTDADASTADTSTADASTTAQHIDKFHHHFYDKSDRFSATTRKIQALIAANAINKLRYPMKFNTLRRLLKPLLRRKAPSPKSTFNPSPEQVLGLATKPILFIHVGKCAGTSIRDALLDLIPTGFTLHEMHCRDANLRIADVVKNDNREIEYVICTRDPISRFVSAFNWDKHNMHFQGTLKGRKEGLAYEQFPTVNALAQGLGSPITEERELATTLATSKSLHMGMGQSWYTPLEIAKSLPPDRTSIIDAYSVTNGILKLTNKLGFVPPGPSWDAPREKSDYKLSYPDHDKQFPTSLSTDEKKTLEACLKDDLQVYQILLEIDQNSSLKSQ